MKSLAQRLTLPLLVGLLFCSPVSAAFLEGHDMAAVLTHQQTPSVQEIYVVSQFVEVGPAVEFPDFGDSDIYMLPALVDIDVSDRQIIVTALIDQPPAFREFFEISDVFGTIPKFTKAKINPATNWAGFTQPNRASAAADFILVNISQLTGLQGQQIVIDVVPEPATAGLAAMGLLLAAWRRLA